MSPYSGGDEGNRTPDLLLARQALSHLSYTPESLLPWVFRSQTRSIRFRYQSLKIEQQSGYLISIPFRFYLGETFAAASLLMLYAAARRLRALQAVFSQRLTVSIERR